MRAHTHNTSIEQSLSWFPRVFSMVIMVGLLLAKCDVTSHLTYRVVVLCALLYCSMAQNRIDGPCTMSANWS